jgi:hypothetical protein
MILKGPPYAPPQAKALIDKLLAGGCDCGSRGEARLVKRPVGASGTQCQIVLQCTACGAGIGSAQSHAALFDEKLRRRSYNADGDRLAAEASVHLGFEVRASAEIFPIKDHLAVLGMLGADIGLAEAMQQLGATRAWSLKEGYALLGLVCEGGLIEVEATEIAAMEVHRLKSGYLALIDLEMIFAFLMLAVQRVYDMELGWGGG